MWNNVYVLIASLKQSVEGLNVDNKWDLITNPSCAFVRIGLFIIFWNVNTKQRSAQGQNG